MADLELKISEGTAKFFIHVTGTIYFDCELGNQLVDFGIPEILVGGSTDLNPVAGLEYNGSAVYKSQSGNNRLVKTKQAGWLYGPLGSVEPRFVYELETGTVLGADDLYRGTFPAYGNTQEFSRYLYQGSGPAPTVTVKRNLRKYYRTVGEDGIVPYDYIAGVYVSDHDDSKIVIGDHFFNTRNLKPHPDGPTYGGVIVHADKYYLVVSDNGPYKGEILPTGITVDSGEDEDEGSGGSGDGFDGPFELRNPYDPGNYANVYFKLERHSADRNVLVVRYVPVKTVIKATDPGFGTLTGRYVRNVNDGSDIFARENGSWTERISRMEISGDYYRWVLSNAPRAGISAATSIFLVKPSPLSEFGSGDKLNFTKVEFVESVTDNGYTNHGYLRYAMDDKFQRIVLECNPPEDEEDTEHAENTTYETYSFTLALAENEGYYVAQGLSWV